MENKTKTRKYLWILTAISALILSVLTFTPLVVPVATYKPELFGMPYTLWSGVIVMFLYVLLTWFATFVHPGNENE